jgi:hypothetical protein
VKKTGAISIGNVSNFVFCINILFMSSNISIDIDISKKSEKNSEKYKIISKKYLKYFKNITKIKKIYIIRGGNRDKGNQRSKIYQGS